MLDLITLLLILGPRDLPEVRYEVGLEASARRVCALLELAGAHEWRNDRCSYSDWVNWARCELPRAQRWPGLEVCRGLCSHAWAQEVLRGARAYCDWLGVDGVEFWRLDNHGADAYTRRWVWERAALATDGRAPWLARRRALGELVDWCGWRAVLTAELPAPIPPLPKR